MEKLNIETIAEIKKSIHAITVKTPMTIKIILFIMSLFLFVDTKIQQIIFQENLEKCFKIFSPQIHHRTGNSTCRISC